MKTGFREYKKAFLYKKKHKIKGTIKWDYQTFRHKIIEGEENENNNNPTINNDSNNNNR